MQEDQYTEFKSNFSDAVQSKIDIPTRTLQRWLKGLINDNKIEFKGSTKTGGYFTI